MQEPELVPADVARAAMFALIHCPYVSEDGRTYTEELRNKAFAWIDSHSEPYDEMGG